MSTASDTFKVFVSFARDHETFLPVVFERLEAQTRLEVWNYGEDGQEIPLGDELVPHLRQRIRDSDVFVAIVTPRYLSSRFTELEVAEAIACYRKDGRPRIFPLITAAADPFAHSEDARNRFGALLDFKNEGVDFTSVARVDAAIGSICDALRIEPTLRMKEDPRLPMMAKVFEEVRRLPRATDRGNAIFLRLMRVLRRFQEAYALGNGDEAQRLIALLTETYRFEYGTVSYLYYPAIIRATVLASQGQMDTCHAILDQLAERAGADGRLDANLYSARGHAFFQAGRFAAAAECYKEAVERNSGDVSDRCNEIICRLRAGLKLNLDDAFRTIDQALLASKGRFVDEHDQRKTELFKAVALRSAGEKARASAEFERLLARYGSLPDVVCEYIPILNQDRNSAKAQSLLQQALDGAKDHGGVLHRLAQVLATGPQPAEGLDVYERLSAHRPAIRRNFFEAMRGFWRAEAFQGAKKVATALVDKSVFGLPCNAWDFYCCGAAWWVLDRPERARYDFERSGFRDIEGYAHTLGQPRTG